MQLWAKCAGTADGSPLPLIYEGGMDYVWVLKFSDSAAWDWVCPWYIDPHLGYDEMWEAVLKCWKDSVAVFESSRHQWIRAAETIYGVANALHTRDVLGGECPPPGGFITNEYEDSDVSHTP